MSELEAMSKVDAILAALAEDERNRLLQWAFAKYSTQPAITKSAGQSFLGASANLSGDGKEIPGIAAITPSGEFKLTVRDVKAKNTNDAAVRIAHIAIWAHQQLTGEPTMSSKRVLLPLLRTWRAYSGNTRLILAKHKGILRDGDNLSLDTHSANEAQKYIQEVQDEEVVGTWTPRAISKKKRSVKPTGS